MTITKARFQRFTAFDDLTVDLSPGINVFIGENGTGKTHILKALYAACDVTKSGLTYAEKLVRVFLPLNRAPGRLVKRQRGNNSGTVSVWRGRHELTVSINRDAKVVDPDMVSGQKLWSSWQIESVYVPVKEMLSNAPGFRSLYSQREIHFEEIYADILDRAYRPVLRGAVDGNRRKLLESLQGHMDGRVSINDEQFFLRNRSGNLEFTLLAEGLRKLGLLWLLIQNGTLLEGAILFWDEPETNLNPKLFGVLVDIFLKLQRLGVQVCFATHDYVMLKELDLKRTSADKITFHSLFRADGSIQCHQAGTLSGLEPNAITDTFAGLYDREVRRSLKGQRS